MDPKYNRKVGQCVYCGECRPLSRDHIPPANLFGKPRPSNLITIPSCHACNKAASLDDEYFRLAITAGIDPAKFSKPEFDMSLEAIHKLGTPGKLGLAKAMLSNFSKRAINAPAGLCLGKVSALSQSVDAGRVQRVVARVIRGLFFHHFGRRLPSACPAQGGSNYLLVQLSEAKTRALRQKGPSYTIVTTQLKTAVASTGLPGDFKAG